MNTTATLLDEVLPEFDFRSRHSRRVAASLDQVIGAVDALELGVMASWLACIRGLRVPREPLLNVLERSGFTLLAARGGEELVYGTTGQFWRLHEEAHMEAPVDLEGFRAFDRPGWARAVVSLRLEPRDDGWTDVTTETRVACVDEWARRRFALYWMFIKPFSDWLRQDFLREIARIAEAAA